MLEVLARIRHRRTCRQLSPYLDGMLSARESRRLEEHLAQCQECRDELAGLQATVQALAELPLAEAPRSFALTATPRRVEALRPAARRVEFGLRLATAAAAFVLAVVAAGDLVGLPGGGEEEESAALQMRPLAVATETGVGEQRTLEVQPSQATAEDKALTVAPTAAVPGGPGGAEGEATAEPPAGFGEPSATGTPSSEPPALAPSGPPEWLAPGIAETATPAATAAPAATAPPAAMPAPAGTPALAETPFLSGPAGTPEVASSTAAPETAAATATSPPVSVYVAPGETEEQPLSEADGQALAEARRETRAAEEAGPSRETVVRWLEIGLATGVALLFVSWVLARRRGRA